MSGNTASERTGPGRENCTVGCRELKSTSNIGSLSPPCTLSLTLLLVLSLSLSSLYSLSLLLVLSLSLSSLYSLSHFPPCTLSHTLLRVLSRTLSSLYSLSHSPPCTLSHTLLRALSLSLGAHPYIYHEYISAGARDNSAVSVILIEQGQDQLVLHAVSLFHPPLPSPPSTCTRPTGRLSHSNQARPGPARAPHHPAAP
jgi:hypothetical protein